jgi:hypothetical protein
MWRCYRNFSVIMHLMCLTCVQSCNFEHEISNPINNRVVEWGSDLSSSCQEYLKNISSVCYGDKWLCWWNRSPPIFDCSKGWRCYTSDWCGCITSDNKRPMSSYLECQASGCLLRYNPPLRVESFNKGYIRNYEIERIMWFLRR